MIRWTRWEPIRINIFYITQFHFAGSNPVLTTNIFGKVKKQSYIYVNRRLKTTDMIRKKQKPKEIIIDLTGPEGNSFALKGFLWILMALKPNCPTVWYILVLETYRENKLDF